MLETDAQRKIALAASFVVADILALPSLTTTTFGPTPASHQPLSSRSSSVEPVVKDMA